MARKPARTSRPKAENCHDKWMREGREKIEALRRDPARYIEVLELLLLEAEDVALYRGDWCLCESMNKAGDIYPSQLISDVLDNIRERQPRNA